MIHAWKDGVSTPTKLLLRLLSDRVLECPFLVKIWVGPDFKWENGDSAHPETPSASLTRSCTGMSTFRQNLGGAWFGVEKMETRHALKLLLRLLLDRVLKCPLLVKISGEP